MRRVKVLVIGAASGLGKAVVAQAAARSDRVCTIDVDIHAVGDVDGVVASVACDISDACAIEQALDTLEQEAPFDLVVISAGISATGPFEEIDPALMSRVINVNLTGTMMMTAALLKRSMIARAGRLVRSTGPERMRLLRQNHNSLKPFHFILEHTLRKEWSDKPTDDCQICVLAA